MFVDRHKEFDIVEDRSNFLKKMEELKSYMVEFNKNSNIKPKIYPPNCTVESENQWLIIVITHNECTFSTNDSVQKGETWEGNTFLQPKEQRQDIIVLKFLLPFGRLNLSFLSLEKR